MDSAGHPKSRQSVSSRGSGEVTASSASQYVKLNVGGSLHYTTVSTLTKQDSMLRAMFSGRMEVLKDQDGWVLIDRSGKHFGTILNYLRDGTVPLPKSRREIQEILAEAKYYCIQGLSDDCHAFLDAQQKTLDDPRICRLPIISSQEEERTILSSTSKPVIRLLLNRHNNKYSYTNQSDDNLLRNLELFDKLLQKFFERVLFVKCTGASNEVCSWTFYGHGRKVAEVCCTSIVYATDKKHTKVEFPEARILEEAMSILLYEDGPTPGQTCSTCGSVYSYPLRPYLALASMSSQEDSAPASPLRMTPEQECRPVNMGVGGSADHQPHHGGMAPLPHVCNHNMLREHAMNNRGEGSQQNGVMAPQQPGMLPQQGMPPQLGLPGPSGGAAGGGASPGAPAAPVGVVQRSQEKLEKARRSLQR